VAVLSEVFDDESTSREKERQNIGIHLRECGSFTRSRFSIPSMRLPIELREIIRSNKGSAAVNMRLRIVSAILPQQT
jgi:hypothetical protein